MPGRSLIARFAQRATRTRAWAIAIGARRQRAPWRRDASELSFTLVQGASSGDLADPLLFEHEGRTYLFCEELDRSTCRGRIVSYRVTDDLELTDFTVVLERPYHLSYPFVFEVAGQVLLIPESAANQTVDLYACRRFPDRWEAVRTLFDARVAVDTTAHVHDDRIWFFTALRSPRAQTAEELHLFSTTDLTGPLRAHRSNPVVTDAGRARGAGRMFVDDGRLIRPAQDCSERYGAAVVFNEVTSLSQREYREQPVGRLTPEWCPGADGCHTWTASSRHEVTDVARWVPRFGRNGSPRCRS